jgi:hypothetical protein
MAIPSDSDDLGHRECRTALLSLIDYLWPPTSSQSVCFERTTYSTSPRIAVTSDYAGNPEYLSEKLLTGTG